MSAGVDRLQREKDLAYWQRLRSDDPEAFERAFLAATDRERDYVLELALERMTGEQRAAWVERIRAMAEDSVSAGGAS